MIRAVPALPFLVAAAPIIHLWGENAGDVHAGQALTALGVVWLATGLLLLPIWWRTRDGPRSALSLSIAWLPLLTFGRQLDAVPDEPRWLLLGLNLLAGALAIILVWRRPAAARLAIPTTIAATIFVALSVPSIATNVRIHSISSPEVANTAIPNQPDIFHIILDGYARDDVLADLYGFDNRPFLEALRERGFYVADAAYSNYALTSLSLASVLNMRYIREEEDAAALIFDSSVVRELKERGYRYVHFASPWHLTRAAPLADEIFRGGLGEFERVLLRGTIVRLLPPPGLEANHLSTLDRLADMPAFEGPSFVLAHLLLPHPPWVFDRHGNVVERWGYLGGAWDDPDAYLEQVRFVNDRLIEIIDALAERDPIIIIHGDHGSAFQMVRQGRTPTAYWERMAILSAYRIGPESEAELYPTISPVNSFRFVWWHLFQAELDLLPDRSYFSWYDDTPMTDITDLLPPR